MESSEEKSMQRIAKHQTMRGNIPAEIRRNYYLRNTYYPFHGQFDFDGQYPFHGQYDFALD